jgi:hypothetical protein
MMVKKDSPAAANVDLAMEGFRSNADLTELIELVEASPDAVFSALEGSLRNSSLSNQGVLGVVNQVTDILGSSLNQYVFDSGEEYETMSGVIFGALALAGNPGGFLDKVQGYIRADAKFSGYGQDFMFVPTFVREVLATAECCDDVSKRIVFMNEQQPHLSQREAVKVVAGKYFDSWLEDGVDDSNGNGLSFDADCAQRLLDEGKSPREVAQSLVALTGDYGNGDAVLAAGPVGQRGGNKSGIRVQTTTGTYKLESTRPDNLMLNLFMEVGVQLPGGKGGRIVSHYERR